MREETDGLGSRQLAGDDLRGIHTARALENFPVSAGRPRPELIHALFQVKLACWETNVALGVLPVELVEPVRAALREGVTGQLDDWFSISMYQGGAGTSLNMNANEVAANRALQHMGVSPGRYDVIHPILHLNRHQSTNDVIPTAGRVAALVMSAELEEAVLRLQEVCQEKERELDGLVKPGRTQLMDAVPVTLGREFSAYAGALSRDRWRIFKITERLREVNLGGTAVGTGYLAPRDYIFRVVDELKRITGFPLARAENLMDATQNVDPMVEAHGILTACAATLAKISSDLRLLSSGPDAGIGEIRLPAVQAGSSIMPHKVNPVVPEFVTACAFRVQSNHQLMTTAASSGSLELNPFMPVLIHGLLESLHLLAGACRALAGCISGIAANEERLAAYRQSDSLVTYALAMAFGYDRAGELARAAAAAGESVRSFVIRTGAITETELDHLLAPEQVLRLGF